MNESGPGPSTSRARTTANPRHFVFAFLAFVFIHFFATWLLTGLSWNHDWAESVADVLWRPCAQLVSALPAGKPWVMFAMFCSSLVWGSVAFAVLVLARGLFRHRRASP